MTEKSDLLKIIEDFELCLEGEVKKGSPRPDVDGLLVLRIGAGGEQGVNHRMPLSELHREVAARGG